MFRTSKNMIRLLTVLLAIQFSCPGAGWAQDNFFSSLSVLRILSQNISHSALLKGLIIHPDYPLALDFLIDRGEGVRQDQEYDKLIKYFFAALTIPEADMWVNLSPYEKDRVVPENFGQTAMGRDLLAQDYELKQLTASLLDPQHELGRKFWQKIMEDKKTSSGGVDVNVFHKIWIVPKQARVYEHRQGAFVVESYLSVLLEEDYLAQKQSGAEAGSSVAAAIFRETILPEIEKQVNQGPVFSNLRQIYHSMILAVWYKRALKKSVLGEFYVDQSRIDGIRADGVSAAQTIYEQYLQAFTQGAYDNIKEDYDPQTSGIVLRKYFSGGALPLADSALLVETGSDRGSLVDLQKMYVDVISVVLDEAPRSADKASLVQDWQLQAFINGIKDPRYKSFVDVSLEAAISKLSDFAGGALGKGGLGFLTGDTWSAYHLLEKFRGLGVMPLYENHYDGHVPVDWDNEPGINRVILDNGEALTLDVDFLGRSFPVPVYWINCNGMPVFLLRSPDFFKSLYPGGEEQDQQYGFIAKAYVELMQRLEISPKIVRLSEPQLVFVATAMENDRKKAEQSGRISVFKDSKIVFTTHTPETAGLPFFRDLNALGRLIGRELFQSLIYPVWSTVISAVEAMAYYADIINAVSLEHGTVTKEIILSDPDYVKKTTAIQNGSAGEIWRSKALNTLIKRVGLKGVTGKDLFDIKKAVKEKIFQKFLKKSYGVQFDDPDRPLVGLVRRLVAYKEQRMLIPLARWITGDKNTDYYNEETGEYLGKGLGANLLVGGHALDDVTRGWKAKFEALAADPELKGKFIYVPKTGILFRKLAVAASDLWLSMPRPTREASGTSDSAAALNGTVNIATATGGPLSYIKHGENGWLINVFKGWDLSYQIREFDRNNDELINKFYTDGGRELAQYCTEAMTHYYNYTEQGNPEWLEMMHRSFVDSHRKVSIEVMIQKYGLLFESVLDGTGAAGYEKKQAEADAAYQTASAVDAAQLFVTGGPDRVGGIDLNSRNMDFDVHYAQGHVILPDMPDMDAVAFSRYQPVIAGIRPSVPVSSLLDFAVSK